MRHLLIGLVCTALGLGCGGSTTSTPPAASENTPSNTDKGGKAGSDKGGKTGPKKEKPTFESPTDKPPPPPR